MIHEAQCQFRVATAARRVVRADEGTWLPRKTIIEFTRLVSLMPPTLAHQGRVCRVGHGIPREQLGPSARYRLRVPVAQANGHQPATDAAVDDARCGVEAGRETFGEAPF